MITIKDLKARQILDSRGNPTIEVDIWTENNFARASVPSGASTGKHEAVELRDGGNMWTGKGVSKAVENVHGPLRGLLVGSDPYNQVGLDSKMKELDGTENKRRLGANAILGCSLAIAKVAAMEKGVAFYEYLHHLAYGMPGDIASETESPPRFARRDDKYILPVPMMNVINGGAHADNTLDIQEFMIVPEPPGPLTQPSRGYGGQTGGDGPVTFADRLQVGVEVFHSLKRLLQERNLSTSVGDEGGFAPDLQTNEEAIGLILEAADIAGHADSVKIALDCAASEFYKADSGLYVIEGENTSADKLIEYYAYLCDKYPIVSIEDPLDEDDWESWVKLTEKLGDKVQIVGDDLLVTNVTRLQRAIDEKACNAILIKLNQIGTLSETIEAIKLAKDSGFKAIVSHRSGETEDTSIADLAVGLATGQIKTGSLSRTDRVCKYNQLLRIEESLNHDLPD